MLGVFKNIYKSVTALRCQDAGATAVEMALVMPVYLAMIFFVVEAGRVAYTQGVVVHAAEEATRYALVHYDATAEEIQDFARANLLGVDPDNLTAIVVTSPTDPIDQTKLVTVEVSYRYEPILPVLEFASGGTTEGFNLRGASKGFLTQEIPES